MNKNLPKLITVVGPTASGKSDLAVKLALKFNGEIISADSRQVYKGLDIGSGKITRKEMKGVVHHLLDVSSPSKIFDSQKYQDLGIKAINKIIKKNKVPIICGGTGFYIDALIYNYIFPKAKPNKDLRKSLEKISTENLYEKIKKLDFEFSKKIDSKNRRRLIRAIEIATELGKVPKLEKKINYQILKIGIKKDKKELEKLITKRLYKRLKIGMIEEVEKLHQSGLSWKKLDDFGLEYRFIARNLQGLISKAEMEKLIINESLKYAKRQMTWFGRDKEINWIENPKESFALIKNFLK